MTCPHHGEIPEHERVWVTTFPANRLEEEEGVWICPDCNHILKEIEDDE